MEMIWRGSRNYGKDSQIFTGVNYNGYGPPGGFCFDDYCSDPPIQDDPRLFDNNVKERVDLFDGNYKYLSKSIELLCKNLACLIHKIAIWFDMNNYYFWTYFNAFVNQISKKKRALSIILVLQKGLFSK